MKDTFFFQRYGSGKPIVALHGNPGTHRDFDRIKKYIDMEEYSFLALDRVGHGRNYHLLGNDAISCYCDFIAKCNNTVYSMVAILKIGRHLEYLGG